MVYKKKSNPEHAKFRTHKVWKDFRDGFIKARDGICDLCGRRYPASSLNVHHRFLTNYENLTEDRFMLLCSSCHDYVHLKYTAPNFKDKGWFGLRDEEQDDRQSDCKEG